MPELVDPVAWPLPALERAPEAPRTWILIGPLARECRLWADAPALLAAGLGAIRPEARLWLLDLPGTGEANDSASPARVEALVRNLRERAQADGLLGQKIGLLASSWSSALATEWARAHPGEVAALVLISPAMRPFTTFLRRFNLAQLGDVARLALGRWARGSRDRCVWRTQVCTRVPSDSILDQWRGVAQQRPIKARTGLAQGWAVWRYAGSTRRPQAKVLLLAGRGDQWLNWRIAGVISRAWGAAVRIHPEAGHDLLLDDPDWVARSVAEWLLPVGAGGLFEPVLETQPMPLGRG